MDLFADTIDLCLQLKGDLKMVKVKSYTRSVENFKMGDIVIFNDTDWEKIYNRKYEVGFVTSSGKIKLQDIKTKQRLPYTFEPTSIKKLKKIRGYKR